MNQLKLYNKILLRYTSTIIGAFPRARMENSNMAIFKCSQLFLQQDYLHTPRITLTFLQCKDVSIFLRFPPHWIAL